MTTSQIYEIRGFITIVIVLIVIIVIASIYAIHKSIDRLTEVQVAQNEILAQLLREMRYENQILATKVSGESTHGTDNNRIEHK